MKALRAGSVPEEAIKRGKAGLKAAILSAAESALNVTEDIGQQALLRGSAETASALASAVDSVSSSEVNNVSLSTYGLSIAV